MPIVYIYSYGFVPIGIADEMEGRESPAKLHFFSPPSDLISPDTKLDQLPKEFYWATGTIPYNHICFYQKPRIGLIRRYSFSQKINGISQTYKINLDFNSFIYQKKTNLKATQIGPSDVMSQNMNLHESEALKALLPKCLKKDRKAQEELFRLTYPFAISICLRYSANRAEAKEIVNDGFFKVFSQLDKYNAELSFAGWMRKIMINCAIDHFRKIKRYNERHPDLSHMKDEPQVEGILDKISAEEIITLVQELPPAYRMVFTLFAVEEYTHREIAEKLGISEGTSKSNYSKAKLKIKNRLIAINPSLEEQYGA